MRSNKLWPAGRARVQWPAAAGAALITVLLMLGLDELSAPCPASPTLAAESSATIGT